MTNRTADSTTLKTWWHNSREINTNAPVASAASANDYYDSFVYETIPRNGNGNICIPGDLSSVCSVDDQITIEPDIGVTMAWTQFLYGSDAIIKISRSNCGSMSADNVVIRPTNLAFEVPSAGDAVLISVPWSANGNRFSVEFQDDLWTYRNAGPGIDSHYVQNVNPDGVNYVSEYDDLMPIVGVEPLNALLIFASPFPSSDLILHDEADSYHVPPGLVTNLDQVSQSVVYFDPGVYYLLPTRPSTYLRHLAGLLGINPLDNIDTMTFENIWIEELAHHTTLVDTSTFTVFTDANSGNKPIALGVNSPNNLGLVIKDFYVGDEHVALAGNNWDSYSTGRLNIDGSYWGRWTAV